MTSWYPRSCLLQEERTQPTTNEDFVIVKILMQISFDVVFIIFLVVEDVVSLKQVKKKLRRTQLSCSINMRDSIELFDKYEAWSGATLLRTRA